MRQGHKSHTQEAGRKSAVCAQDPVFISVWRSVQDLMSPVNYALDAQ